MSPQQTFAIVAFDGVCNLCNATVNWIIDNDSKKQFKFIALQDIDRIKDLPVDFQRTESYQSVYLIEHGKLYQKSTAVLKICQKLSGLYPLLYLYIIIPRPLRDLVYDLIAQNRYKWFGKRSHCRIPSPELKERFL